MAISTAEVQIEEPYTGIPAGHILCKASIPFGASDPWLYLPHSKRFDLSRGSTRQMVIDCDEDIHNHCGFIIDPSQSVLIVVDMQNYFIHPIYRDHAAGLAAVDPTLKAIERCRKDGIPVIWLNWGITEDDLQIMPPAVQRGFSKSLGWHIGLGAQLPGEQGRCLFKGAWNTELYPRLKATVQPSDRFFDKNRMSGLWSTSEPLHQYLRGSGKTTLLFAGVNTDQCVLGTLSDAYSWGWDCVLLSDCTGTMTGRGAQEVCNYNIATNMGFVTDSDSFCRAQSVNNVGVNLQAGILEVE